MPFKSVFKGNSKTKVARKQGTHIQKQHYFEPTEEPPDHRHILEQIKEMKLHKHQANVYTSDKNMRRESTHSANAERNHSLPLLRASTEPLTVSSYTANRGVTKSLSEGEALENGEDDLHCQRLKDLTQLDSYIRHLRCTSDEDVIPFMPSRLCCANLLMTLYLRHERQYINMWRARSPSDGAILNSPPLTLTEAYMTNAHSPVCSTCSEPATAKSFQFLQEISHKRGECVDGAVREENNRYDFSSNGISLRRRSEPIAVFRRQSVGRIPVTGRRHRPRPKACRPMNRPSSSLGVEHSDQECLGRGISGGSSQETSVYPEVRVDSPLCSEKIPLTPLPVFQDIDIY